MLEAKFCDCVSFVGVTLAPKNVDAAIALIDDLENVTDIAEITLLLTPKLAT